MPLRSPRTLLGLKVYSGLSAETPLSSKGMILLVVTTPTVEGMPVKQHIGMVSGETIAGVNMFKDFAAGLSNMFGGRANSYENEIANASRTAVNEMCTRAQSMGANAVVGVHVDYFTAGADNAMLAAIATGTAVVL